MSKFTAMQRKSPSLPAKYLAENGLLTGDCLGFGCGRGFDKDFYGLDGYDPNWMPEFPSKKYDTIMCNYVLNVVTEEVEKEILGQISGLLKENGVAYVSVRRDYQEDFAGRNCTQRFVTLNAETLHVEKGKYEIYVIRKS